MTNYMLEGQTCLAEWEPGLTGIDDDDDDDDDDQAILTTLIEGRQEGLEFQCGQRPKLQEAVKTQSS